ncbi:hypothetical protein D3C75_489990 [compost metagenome]
MINAVILKDVVLAIGWAISRVVPVWVYLIAVRHIREDAFIPGLVLTTILFLVVYAIIIAMTNTWPALFWRYNSKLVTRQIREDGDDLHQVKILGAWHFIKFSDDNNCTISMHTWSTPYRFEHNFLSFVNAHRDQDNPRVSNVVTYVRGEPATK